MDYHPQILDERTIKQETTQLRVAMLQIEDRVDPFFEWCIQLNKGYCDKFQINHILLRKGPSDKPAYWWKVSVFLDVLESNNYDIVCWMDSDAFVYNQTVDLRDFFNTPKQAMVIAPDPVGWGSPFMAAVFMARNNEVGKRIFKDWLNCYDAAKWVKSQNGFWEYVGDGGWAGIDYEQGAFAKIILPKYYKVVKVVPWYVFHETNCQSPNQSCWSIHLPRHIKQLRPNCIVFEQTRNQVFRFDFSAFIITAIIAILTLIIGLYFWIKKNKL